MARNCHHVPKRQWDKWRGRPQAMFNRLWTQLGFEYSLVIDDAHLLNVVRWNACRLAAEVEKELEADAKLGWFDKKRSAK